jgi:hypothetical protein
MKGPYSSEASVTLMIARQLRREIVKQDGVHKLPEYPRQPRSRRAVSLLFCSSLP